MRKIYKTFTEMAKDFRNGELWTYQLSDHICDDCVAWQHGIMEFAKWLDEVDIKMIENPGIPTKPWDDARTYPSSIVGGK